MAKTLTNLSNRKSRQEIKATVATTDPLADYENRRTSFWGELIIQGLPPWYIWIGRAMLDSDPLVRFAINVRNAALMPAEITVKAKNEMYAAWIQKQWDFLWNHHRSKFTSAKKYGFAALQAVWKLDEREYLTLTDCKDYSPEDSKCLIEDNRIVGMTVKGRRVFSPQALWMTFGSEFGNPYGTGILRRMYPAWFEKWMNHGAKKLLQLRMLKDAYIGDIFWYPPDQIVEIPDGQGGVKSMPWRDVFREIGENRTSGNVLTLPLLLDANGKELTRYTPPQDTGSASQIFEWNDLVDSKILQAADVPREVIEAAETGSGYSGRSIPFLTMLSVCNDELVEMVQCFRRLIEPVIWLNWGVEPDFEIIPSNLVETFSDDTQGSPMGGGAIGGQPGQQPPVQLLQAPPQQGQQYSENEKPKGLKERYTRVRGGVSDGRRVLKDIPNTGSISATFDSGSYRVMPGIRNVGTHEFAPVNPKQLHYNAKDHEHIQNLSKQIGKSNKIKPLIVVHDHKEGPYILEGSHRLPALQLLGAKHVPAMVVVPRKKKAPPQSRFNDDSQYAENEHNHKATELTHEIGTHPIPEGHIRAFHYTRGDVNSIKKDGLKLSHSRGESYGEPKMIWGSSNQPDHGHKIVEFHIPHNDKGIALGGSFQQDHTHWNKTVNHVGMNRDIKPHEILAVHEPWHHRYHYIKNRPDIHKAVVAGKHDHIMKHEEYGKAIEQIKKEAGSQHAEQFMEKVFIKRAFGPDHVIHVHKNLSADNLHSFAKNTEYKSVRGFTDHNTGHHYYWDAEKSIHSPVLHAMGIKHKNITQHYFDDVDVDTHIGERDDSQHTEESSGPFRHISTGKVGDKVRSTDGLHGHIVSESKAHFHVEGDHTDPSLKGKKWNYKVMKESGKQRNTPTRSFVIPVSDSQHSEQFGEHSYCSTQFNLSGSVAEEIKALGLQIPDEDLVSTDYGTETKSGRENEPHITLLWGIH